MKKNSIARDKRRGYATKTLTIGVLLLTILISACGTDKSANEDSSSARQVKENPESIRVMDHNPTENIPDNL